MRIETVVVAIIIIIIVAVVVGGVVVVVVERRGLGQVKGLGEGEGKVKEHIVWMR